MKQRYNDFSHELCERAVFDFFDEKWRRNDVLTTIEEYAGIDRYAIKDEVRHGVFKLRLEAAEAIAYEMENRIEALMSGVPNALDIDPVVIKPRVDPGSGKLRDTAYLCVFHQLFDHLLELGLRPLFNARILHSQCASVPGRGQKALLRKLQKAVRKGSIKYAKKDDVHHAYDTTMYSDVIALIKAEIPSAEWIIKLTEALADNAPGGHLIIGGYIDGWFFNFLLSYAIRHVIGLSTERRGKKSPMVLYLVTYMDDISTTGSRLASLRTASRKLSVYLKAHFGLELNSKVHEVQFLTVEEENELRRQGKSAPGLDMGGFVVHRTYTSIRRRLYRQIRRHYLRAGRELESTGTVPLFRARKLVSYYGYFKLTDVRKARMELSADKLFGISKKIIAAHDKLAAQKARLIYA